MNKIQTLIKAIEKFTYINYPFNGNDIFNQVSQNEQYTKWEVEDFVDATMNVSADELNYDWNQESNSWISNKYKTVNLKQDSRGRILIPAEFMNLTRFKVGDKLDLRTGYDYVIGNFTYFDTSPWYVENPVSSFTVDKSKNIRIGPEALKNAKLNPESVKVIYNGYGVYLQ